jgi:hypothetical protein
VSRWDAAGLVSAVALVAGFWALLWGLVYNEPVLDFWGAAGLGAGVGGASVITYAWVAWHRAHGSWACFVWQWRGRMVHHFHWPKERIVTCTNSAGFAGRRIR